LVNLGGGEGQESIDLAVRLTAYGSSTDSQLEQSSKVGGSRQPDDVPLDRCNAAELRYESLCTNP